MRRCSPLLLAALVLLLSVPSLRAQDTMDSVARFAALGRAWGLAKYFHPDITAGNVDWDAALIEAVPRVASASTRTALNKEILRLLRRAGPEPRLRAGVSATQAESDPAFACIANRARHPNRC